MRWRNTEEELPAAGTRIWALEQHRKRNGICSCQIVGGEVWEGKDGKPYFINNDDIGCGSYMLSFKENDVYDYVSAWLPEEELAVPRFLSVEKQGSGELE